MFSNDMRISVIMIIIIIVISIIIIIVIISSRSIIIMNISIIIMGIWIYHSSLWWQSPDARRPRANRPWVATQLACAHTRRCCVQWRCLCEPGKCQQALESRLLLQQLHNYSNYTVRTRFKCVSFMHRLRTPDPCRKKLSHSSEIQNPGSKEGGDFPLFWEGPPRE